MGKNSIEHAIQNAMEGKEFTIDLGGSVSEDLFTMDVSPLDADNELVTNDGVATGVDALNDVISMSSSNSTSEQPHIGNTAKNLILQNQVRAESAVLGADAALSGDSLIVDVAGDAIAGTAVARAIVADDDPIVQEVTEMANLENAADELPQGQNKISWADHELSVEDDSAAADEESMDDIVKDELAMGIDYELNYDEKHFNAVDATLEYDSLEDDVQADEKELKLEKKLANDELAIGLYGAVDGLDFDDDVFDDDYTSETDYEADEEFAIALDQDEELDDAIDEDDIEIVEAKRRSRQHEIEVEARAELAIALDDDYDDYEDDEIDDDIDDVLNELAEHEFAVALDQDDEMGDEEIEIEIGDDVDNQDPYAEYAITSDLEIDVDDDLEPSLENAVEEALEEIRDINQTAHDPVLDAYKEVFGEHAITIDNNTQESDDIEQRLENLEDATLKTFNDEFAMALDDAQDDEAQDMEQGLENEDDNVKAFNEVFDEFAMTIDDEQDGEAQDMEQGLENEDDNVKAFNEVFDEFAMTIDMPDYESLEYDNDEAEDEIDEPGYYENEFNEFAITIDDEYAVGLEYTSDANDYAITYVYDDAENAAIDELAVSLEKVDIDPEALMAGEVIGSGTKLENVLIKEDSLETDPKLDNNVVADAAAIEDVAMVASDDLTVSVIAEDAIATGIAEGMR
ncbi:MAG: hypothetical protein BEN18_03540 [Epulopiscium sp. Nuni2H_MBin001]|nr:MAG: hypothetical protein BEN18_03540 [Epulopiscium sp. Nuni2H_MBin001]